ncbi:hypothetical protein BASA61_008078 [Batrachochytrium salamandrivorans]|nr:hypothetical protein BASA62_000900 [Batrachochytrium salamandrivorans]KAH6583296.1 hypothetical protein BASA61_008078 [Batrachochytrium salamandrivorans]
MKRTRRSSQIAAACSTGMDSKESINNNYGSSTTSSSTAGWTPLQDNLLLDAAQTHAGKWLPISNCLGSHRSPAQCAARHRHLGSLGVSTVDDLLRLRAQSSTTTTSSSSSHGRNTTTANTTKMNSASASASAGLARLYDNQNSSRASVALIRPAGRTFSTSSVSLAMNTTNASSTTVASAGADSSASGLGYINRSTGDIGCPASIAVRKSDRTKTCMKATLPLIHTQGSATVTTATALSNASEPTVGPTNINVGAAAPDINASLLGSKQSSLLLPSTGDLRHPLKEIQAMSSLSMRPATTVRSTTRKPTRNTTRSRSRTSMALGGHLSLRSSSCHSPSHQASSPSSSPLLSTTNANSISVPPPISTPLSTTSIYSSCPQKTTSQSSRLARPCSDSAAKTQIQPYIRKSRKASKVTRIHSAASDHALSGNTLPFQTLSEVLSTVDSPKTTTTIPFVVNPTDSHNNHTTTGLDVLGVSLPNITIPTALMASSTANNSISFNDWLHPVSDIMSSECQPFLQSEVDLLEAMLSSVNDPLQTTPFPDASDIHTENTEFDFSAIEDLFGEDLASHSLAPIQYPINSSLYAMDEPKFPINNSLIDTDNVDHTLSILDQLASNELAHPYSLSPTSNFTTATTAVEDAQNSHALPVIIPPESINASGNTHLERDLFDLINWDVDGDAGTVRPAPEVSTLALSSVELAVEESEDQSHISTGIDFLNTVTDSFIFDANEDLAALSNSEHLTNDPTTAHSSVVDVPSLLDCVTSTESHPIDDCNTLLHDLFGKDFWAHSELDLASTQDSCSIPLDALTPNMLQLYQFLSPTTQNDPCLDTTPVEVPLALTFPPELSSNQCVQVQSPAILPAVDNHVGVLPNLTISNRNPKGRLHALRTKSNRSTIAPSTHSDDEFLSSFPDDCDLSISRDEVEDLYLETVEMGIEKKDTTVEDISDTPNWVNGCGNIFSWDQIDELKDQLSKSFQLCIQSYCIERQLKGSKSRECQFWEAQLINHTVARESAMRRYGPNTLFNFAGAEHVPRVLSYNFDHLSSEAIEFSANYEWAVQLKLKKEYIGSTGWKMNSKIKSVRTAVLPGGLLDLIEKFGACFDDELKPSIVRVNRSHLVSFSSDEDSLLHYGLLHYGFNDMPSIRAHYLPAKTYNQIKYRYKNLVHRGKTSNKIKELYLQPFRALRLAEKQFVISGAQTFGPVFKYVTARIFPQCPDTLIRFGWNDLVRIGQVKYLWDSIIVWEPLGDSDVRADPSKLKRRRIPSVSMSSASSTKRSRHFRPNWTGAAGKGSTHISPAPASSQTLPLAGLLPPMSQTDLMALWMSATIQLSRVAGASSLPTLAAMTDNDTEQHQNQPPEYTVSPPNPSDSLEATTASADVSKILPFINSDAFSAITSLFEQQITAASSGNTAQAPSIFNSRATSPSAGTHTQGATYSRMSRNNKALGMATLQTPKRTSPADHLLHMSSDAGYLASVQSSEPDLAQNTPLTPPCAVIRPIATKGRPTSSAATYKPQLRSRQICPKATTYPALSPQHAPVDSTSQQHDLDMMNWNSDFETDFETGWNASTMPEPIVTHAPSPRISGFPPLIPTRRSSLLATTGPTFPQSKIEKHINDVTSTDLANYESLSYVSGSRTAAPYSSTTHLSDAISFLGAYNCDTDSDDEGGRSNAGYDAKKISAMDIPSHVTHRQQQKGALAMQAASHLALQVASSRLRHTRRAISALAKDVDSGCSSGGGGDGSRLGASDSEYAVSNRGVGRAGTRRHGGRLDPMHHLRSATNKARRKPVDECSVASVYTKRSLATTPMSS